MVKTETMANGSGAPRRVSRFFGQYVIKHRFQFKFSMVIFIFLAVAAFTIWLEGHFAVKRLVDSGMLTDEQSIQNLQLLNKIVAQTSFLALAITFGLAIFFSHFVAGPIYRFEKVLEEMRGGNLAMTVRLRKHDEFKETAEIFNQALAGLRVKVAAERQSIASRMERARELAAKLRSGGRTAEATELDNLIMEISNIPPQIKI